MLELYNSLKPNSENGKGRVGRGRLTRTHNKLSHKAASSPFYRWKDWGTLMATSSRARIQTYPRLSGPPVDTITIEPPCCTTFQVHIQGSIGICWIHVKTSIVSHAWDFSRLSNLTLRTPDSLAQVDWPASRGDGYDARCGHLGASGYPFTFA